MHPPNRLSIVGIALLTGIAVLFVSGRREARALPVVARYHLDGPRGSCPSRPLRLVVAGDLHVSANTPPTTVAAMVRRINALQPDYVLLVGDYLGHGWPADPVHVNAALAPLSALRPRVGAAAVLGNNDTMVGAQVIAAALHHEGVRVLWNDAWITPDATVLGIADLTTNDANPRQAIDRSQERLRRAKRAPPPLTFWLAHQPVMFDRMDTTGTVLFTGHSHGGQVLPALTVPLAHATIRLAHRLGLASSWPAEHYVRGPYHRGDKRMIVTSGVGVSGLPLRLGVPPEIMLVTVARCLGPQAAEHPHRPGVSAVSGGRGTAPIRTPRL